MQSLKKNSFFHIPLIPNPRPEIRSPHRFPRPSTSLREEWPFVPMHPAASARQVQPIRERPTGTRRKPDTAGRQSAPPPRRSIRQSPPGYRQMRLPKMHRQSPAKSNPPTLDSTSSASSGFGRFTAIPRRMVSTFRTKALGGKARATPVTRRDHIPTAPIPPPRW